MPAILYQRVSHPYLQVGNRSSQFQEEDLPEIAHEWGYHHHLVVNDLGKSAERVGARDMNRIMELCAKKAASAVFLAAFNRLTRDMRRIEGPVLWDAFARAHLAVIVAEQNRLFIPGDERDDEYAHRQFEDAARDNRERAAAFGRGLGKTLQESPLDQGPVMPGWRPVLTPVVRGRQVDLERHLELDDRLDPGWPHPYIRVIEEIFRLAPALADRQLAQELNGRGDFWRCKRWRPEVTDEGVIGYRFELVDWTNDQIARIRRNPRYRGSFAWGRRITSERSRAVLVIAGSVQDGQPQPVVHERPERRIVGDDAWTAASSKPTTGSYPRERGRLLKVVGEGGPAVGLLHPRHLAGEGLFCGLLVCHECQGAMNYSPYTSGRRHRVKVPAYRCNTYLKRGAGACTFSGRIKEEPLFAAFLEPFGAAFGAIRRNLTAAIAQQAALYDDRAAIVAAKTLLHDQLVAQRKEWGEAQRDLTEQHALYRMYNRREIEGMLADTKEQVTQLANAIAALAVPGEPRHLAGLRRALAWAEGAGRNLSAVSWTRAEWKQLIATLFARVEYTYDAEPKAVGVPPEGLVLRDAVAPPVDTVGALDQSSTEDHTYAPVVRLAALWV